MNSRYTPGPDVGPEEELRDGHGNLIGDAYADEAVADVHRAVGRPSLSAQGTRSPQIAFRLPSAEREQARQLAEHQGITISELARRALEEHLHRAS